MRKLYLSIIIVILCLTRLYSQGKTQSVFVMVDLSMNISGDSKPISATMRQDANDFTKSIIMASYKPNQYPDWKKTGVFTSPKIEAIIKGKGSPLIGEDDFLMMMPFGEINSTHRFQINLMSNYPSDFNKYYQFPFSYTDKDTWGNYAEAKMCKIAYDNKIPEYYIVRIQGRPDDPNSMLLDAQDQNMVDEYVTGSAVEVVARFKHTKASRFLVTIKKVDLSKIPGIKNYKVVPIGSTNTDPNRKSLRIISPKGKKKMPFTTTSPNIRVSWNCIGCDSLPKYTLRVNNLDSKKTKIYKITNKTFKSLSLEPATYKINVSAKGANSKAQYITIEGEDEGGGFGILLLLILLGVGGYFVYKYLIAGKKTHTKEKNDWTESKKEASQPDTNGASSDDDDW